MASQGYQFLLATAHDLEHTPLHCIPIGECPYQLKRINKKNKYVIPIILDNEKKKKKMKKRT